MSIRLTQATTECAECPRKFHQIDGSEERALQVVRAALDKHMDAEHPLAAPASRDAQ